VAALGQRREQLVDSRQAPRSRPAELAADEEVLLDRERWKQPAPFGHERNAAGNHRMGRLVPDRLAVE
jgi:hypothetical protein